MNGKTNFNLKNESNMNINDIAIIISTIINIKFNK